MSWALFLGLGGWLLVASAVVYGFSRIINAAEVWWSLDTAERTRRVVLYWGMAWAGLLLIALAVGP